MVYGGSGINGLRRPVVLGVMLGMLEVLAPAAGAGPGVPCRVTNLMTGSVFTGSGANLQSAINAASSGARLRIRGVCVGNYTIAKSLRLVGVATAAYPVPTLDGNATDAVLRVSAGSLFLRDLTITGGAARWLGYNGSDRGGGINNLGGHLTLTGTTSVTANTSPGLGGGIYNAAGGVMRLMGTASVSGNTAPNGSGGGIENSGALAMRGSSSVTGNTAGHALGGGIFNLGTLSLRGSSSVSGNTAPKYGGGIFNVGILTLGRASSVTGNTATEGGGILNDKANGGVFNVCSSWTGAMSPNAPDDPPDDPNILAC